MTLHGKKEINKKDRKGWHCDKISIHLIKFGPNKQNRNSQQLRNKKDEH